MSAITAQSALEAAAAALNSCVDPAASPQSVLAQVEVARMWLTVYDRLVRLG